MEYRNKPEHEVRAYDTAELRRIASEMEIALISSSGDVPDSEAAEMFLEIWLSDTYGNHAEIREMSLRDFRNFVADVAGRYY